MRFRANLQSIIPILLLWLSGCTSATVGNGDWIEVGKTTRVQVVDRYGDPDVTQKLPNGTIATYFPVLTFQRPTSTIPTIRTMQPSSAGFGVATTTQIEPRLTFRDGNMRGPQQGLSIRYDAHDVVAHILDE